MQLLNTSEQSVDEAAGRGAGVGRLFLLVLAALAVSTGLTLWWAWGGAGSYTGLLQAERSVVAAPRDAILTEIVAAEGSLVDKGQTVVTVIDESRSSRTTAHRQTVAQHSTELDRARATAQVDLKWRLKELESEILETRLKAANLLKSHYDLELQKHAWNEFLSGRPGGRGSDVPLSVVHAVQVPDDSRMRAMVEHETAQNALDVVQTQIQLCERRLSELEALKAELPKEVERAHGVEQAEARLREARASLKQSEAQPAKIALAAPAFGTVGLYRKQPGDRVLAGEPIVELLDSDRRFLLVNVPSHELPYFAANCEVSLEFPGETVRTGRVLRIPPQTGPLSSQDDAPQNDRSQISLRIEPTGRLWPQIPIGSQVTVRLAE